MLKRLVIPLCAFIVSPAFGDSLDKHYDEIKIYGGLTSLCKAKPGIEECALAIGDWRPTALSRIKAISPFCIDTCKHDMFGFVQSSIGDREYPVVTTKDFLASAASQGVEISLYPVAMKAFEYKACNGCDHIETYPSSITAILGESRVELPNIGRGTFYIPSKFRKYALSNPNKTIILNLLLPDDTTATARISAKANSEYGKMLRALDYDKIP